MARLVWTEPALQQLEDIAHYIAIDKPLSAKKLVKSVFSKIKRLEEFPESGRTPPELPDSIYRELSCPPCRIFYRLQDKNVIILHVMRNEMQLKRLMLDG